MKVRHWRSSGLYYRVVAHICAKEELTRNSLTLWRVLDICDVLETATATKVKLTGRSTGGHNGQLKSVNLSAITAPVIKEPDI